MNIKITNTTNHKIILKFKADILEHEIMIDTREYQFIPKIMFLNHMEYCYLYKGIENDDCFRVIRDFELIDRNDIEDILEKFNVK